MLSFLSAFTYNQINLKNLPKEKIRENETVITNDDISYLRPPQNYIKTGNWKANSIGKQSYFIRTPGYGIFYMTCLKIANSSFALLFLKIVQHLLFSFSVYWLFWITLSLVKNKKIALITASIYGLSPFAIGFLSYTLTEGISPALLLLYVFLLFKGAENKLLKQKNIYYLLSALTFSYLLIVRAPLGFMGILLPIFIFKDYYKKSALKFILKLVILGSIAFSFMIIWQYRNYKITNEYVGLHPIYYADNNSIYRPTFKEFWNFVGGWAQEGHIAHSYMVPMWSAAINGDTSEYYIKAALNTFPKEVITHFGEDRLFNVFRNYQKATLIQKSYYDKRLPIPKKIHHTEKIVIEEFQQLTNGYKSEFPLQYHILSPLKVFKTMAFHSNLSLYIFQHTFRGNWLMEVVRLLFFSLHGLCFIGLIASLFLIKRSDWKKSALTISVFIYVFYLCYFQRGIEERYTLPILPILLICLAELIKYFYNLLKPTPNPSKEGV
ncbi:MAG: hypothetical protein COB15_03075 [Flavobacteriales bacterium]|nr:MAG: hypothetical protein COB15_03075 [Flavobacteriales bacterium]